MRYLSVCAGIEAVSVAWQPLGWQPAMFAEIDPFCSWLLCSRHGASRPVHMPTPNEAATRKEARQRAAAIRNILALPAAGSVPNFGDFTRIGAADVEAIDLLAGGTPCQSFSIAGKRAGLDDPRGNLTIEFARLADRLRPLWLVWENVPGVLSIDGGRTFGAFLGILIQLAHTLESGASQAVAFNLRGREGGSLPEMAHAASMRAASGGSSNSYVTFSAKDHGADAGDIAPTLRGMGHNASHANGGGQLAVAFSSNQRSEVRLNSVHGSLNSSRGSGNQIDGVIQEISTASSLAPSYRKQVDRSDTRNSPSNPHHAQMAVRRLTPRECERLQGFPDDYTLVEYRGKPAADGPRYRALGNSMAVPVMRWIGQRIAAVDAILRETGTRSRQ